MVLLGLTRAEYAVRFGIGAAVALAAWLLLLNLLAVASTRSSPTSPWTTAPGRGSGAWLVDPVLLDTAGLGQGSAAQAVVRPRLGHGLELGQMPEADQGR